MTRDEAERMVDRYFVLRSHYFDLTLQETAECDEIHNKLLAVLTSSRPVDLHGQIMNIQVDKDTMEASIESSIYDDPIGLSRKLYQRFYKLGHRDARHAAAEIVAGRWRKVAP